MQYAQGGTQSNSPLSFSRVAQSMDQSTLEQIDDILDDQSPMVTPESPGDISTSSPKSTNSDSVLFCLTCGIFEEEMEPQSMILDDESSAYCSQECLDEFQKEVQARIMMECTTCYYTHSNADRREAKTVQSNECPVCTYSEQGQSHI